MSRMHGMQSCSGLAGLVPAACVGALCIALVGCGSLGETTPSPGSPAVGMGCKLDRVVDGDTVDLSCPDGPLRARLTGFDTPELFSPGCQRELALAREAKRATETLWRNADTVSLRGEGNDRYGRTLVAVRLDGIPLSSTLIAQGLARPYSGGVRRSWCT
ncbi:MAG: thermonuclease family protein [Pseudomonadota bacterium]